MNYELLGLVGAIGLSIGVFASIAIGRRMGARRRAAEGEDYSKGVGAIESAVFALLGLILAFCFSGALTRFDARRQLVITEANNIGTAWLRIDLLPQDSQGPIRDLFRRYLDSRIAAYQQLPDFAAFRKELAQTAKLQGEIWSLAVPATAKATTNGTPMLFLDALNSMFDIVTTRTETFLLHSPPVIFYLLAALAFACALFAGYEMAARTRRNLLHSIAFAGVLAVTVYVIVDLEYPRVGLINISDSDQVLINLRQSMQ